MRKLSSDISWSEYLSGIDKMASLVDTKYLDMLLNGESISMLAKSSSARCFNLSYTVNDKVETKLMSFILTADGAKCANPVTIGGTTIESLKWDDAERKLVFKDDKNTIEIGTLPINRIFNSDNGYMVFCK